MINKKRLVSTFKKLVRIDSLSLKEEKISKYLKSQLRALGLKYAEAGKPKGGQVGSLIVAVPGRGVSEPLVLLNAHIDTVGPGKNIKPIEKNGYIYTDGSTVLGADDKSGVAVILEVLRVLVDRPNLNQKYLILGSASRELLQQSSETLTGRICYIELTPFTFNEVGESSKLWHRGGFPRSFLAKSSEKSYLWRQSYLRTFIEQDIPSLGFKVPPQQLRRFWMMLTHTHGNIFNASEIGRSLGLSYKLVQQYIDILTSTLMVRELQPWYENISKRQVKSPKIYFRDSGLFHSLLGVENDTELLRHPKLGSSWEGYALEEVIRFLEVDPFDCYFWATHAHAELDLLIFKKGKRLGFEFKYSDTPKVTKSMRIAMEDLKLDELTIIYPGSKIMKFEGNIRAAGLARIFHET